MKRMRIRNLLRAFRTPMKSAAKDRGLLLFDNTSEVIRAENLLKGFKVRVMGPPPEVRRGCDLAIEFMLVEEPGIIRTLEQKGIRPVESIPITGPHLKPVDLFQTKDYGDYLMVRAANMKITVHKESLRIVNVSGGGCPDVPYLAQELVGAKLFEAKNPRELGHTLCGYALSLAFEEIKKRC